MNERLRTFFDYLLEQRRVFNYRDFGEQIAKSKSQVSNLINGKTGITKRTAEQIKDGFPELNIEWLLHGTGEMLVAPEPVQELPPAPVEASSYLEEQFTEVCQENTQLKIENSRLRQKIFALMERLSKYGLSCSDDTI